MNLLDSKERKVIQIALVKEGKEQSHQVISVKGESMN